MTIEQWMEHGEFSPDFPDKPCFGMLMLGDGEHQDGSG